MAGCGDGMVSVWELCCRFDLCVCVCSGCVGDTNYVSDGIMNTL